MRPERAIALALLIALTACAAAALEALAPLDVSSPRATYRSFVTELEKAERAYVAYRADKTADRYARLEASSVKLRGLFDLSETPPANRIEIGAASLVMLGDIVNRLPLVDLETIPDASDDPPETSWRLPGTAIVIERQAAGPREGDYLFSAETVAQLPGFHAIAMQAPPLRPVAYANLRREHLALTGPVFSYGLLESLPRPLQRMVLDAPLWKVLLTVLLFALLLGAVALVGRLTARLRRHARPLAALAWRLVAPLALAVGVATVGDFINVQVNLSGDFALLEQLFASALLFAALAWAAWLGSFLLVEVVIASPAIPDDSYDAHLLRMLARVMALVAAGGVVVFGLHDLGIPALGLVAGLGVGGFALALAAQSTVENLFGGVSIFADRPFRIGDFIGFGGQNGTVEEIGPRSCRIRALDGTLTTVPNGDLARMHIVNFSARDKCLFLHVIGLRYETTPDQLAWLLDILRRTLAEHAMVEKAPGMPRVRLMAYGASSLDVELRAHVLTTNYSEFLEVQEDLLMEVSRVVARAGAGFAFPSQTAYFARDAGLDEDAQRVAERAGRRLLGRELPEDHPDADSGPDGAPAPAAG